MKRTNIYLTVPSVEKLLELSKKLDVSVSELIRRAIEAYIEKQQRPLK